MKTTLLSCVMLAVFVTAASIVSCEEDTGASFESFEKTMQATPAMKWEIPAQEEQKKTPIKFDGGILAGKVTKEIKDEKEIITINSEAFVLLKKDHKGGSLKLTFAQQPAEPIEARITEYPSSLKPATVQLDGRPLEIEIAPNRIYIHLSLKDRKSITLTDINFSAEAQSSESDPETIKITTSGSQYTDH